MKHRLLIPVVIIVSLLLGACGGLAPLRDQRLRSEAGGAPAPAEESFVEGMSAEAEAPLGMDAAQLSEALPSVEDRLVIRNANLSLVVAEPAESAERIGRMAEEMGGFVVSSNVVQSTYGDSPVGEPIVAKQASITIRVPSDRLNEALERIKDQAVEVQNENVSGQDVTEEFTDLESRLRNLRRTEERLLDIQAEAIKVDDILRIENELTRIRGEIEVIQGRMKYLQDSARLSAITVQLTPDVATRPIQVGRWTPTGTAKEALEALILALQTVADIGIWAAICVLPIGLILGLPGYFSGRAVYRRWSARREAENEAKREG